MASTNNIQWSYKVNAPRPLDASSVFTSLKDAQDAAMTAFYSGTEVASSAGIPYYIGQILTVVTTEGVALYQIQAGEKDADGFVRGSTDLKMVGTGANDEEIKALAERVAALEGKEDKDTQYTAGTGINITGTVVSIADDVKYDDTNVWSEIETISEKVSAIEVREDRDTVYGAGDYINISTTNEISVDRDALNIPEAYDDTALSNKVNSLASKVATLEGKEDRDTTYTAGTGITIEDGVISVKEGVIGEGYDDTDVRSLISANTDNITSLTSKVDALEKKTDEDTTYTAGKGVTISKANEISVNVSDLDLPETYDDTAIKARIMALEGKEDKDTVYDDTSVKSRLDALEKKTDKDTTYSAGSAITISKDNQISVNRDALNIPSEYDDTEIKKSIATNTDNITSLSSTVGTHSTDIESLKTEMTSQTDLIAKYEATLDWIINEYDPSIESEVTNG